MTDREAMQKALGFVVKMWDEYERLAGNDRAVRTIKRFAWDIGRLRMLLEDQLQEPTERKGESDADHST